MIQIGMLFEETNGNKVWEVCSESINLIGKRQYGCQDLINKSYYSFPERDLETYTINKSIKWIEPTFYFKNGSKVPIVSPFTPGYTLPNSVVLNSSIVAYDDLMTVDTSHFKQNTLTLTQLKKNCSHKWKKYMGFTDTYQYCEHCDEKK